MLRAVGVEFWDRVRLLIRIHVSGSKVRVSGLVGLKLKIFIDILCIARCLSTWPQCSFRAHPCAKQTPHPQTLQ